jgi:hypothetical protein
VGLGDPRGCPPGICRRSTEAAHNGIGVQVINTWVVRNPSFSGYFAIPAYLPSSHLSIAVTTTDGPGATTEHQLRTDDRHDHRRVPRAEPPAVLTRECPTALWRPGTGL